jgi:hypothetical protein
MANYDNTLYIHLFTAEQHMSPADAEKLEKHFLIGKQ